MCKGRLSSEYLKHISDFHNLSVPRYMKAQLKTRRVRITHLEANARERIYVALLRDSAQRAGKFEEARAEQLRGLPA